MAIPKDGKPIVQHTSYDEAFTEISKEIKRIVKQKFLEEQQRNVQKTVLPLQQDSSSVRSSTLRIRKDFSDYDRTKFLNEVFEFTATFFENSLVELQNRNPEITYDFRRLDGQAFSAIVFINGKTKSTGMIFMGGSFFRNSINYSQTISNERNSLNDSLSIDDDGYKLFLKSSGFNSFFSSDGPEGQLTFEGAAEYFWKKLLEPLQRNSW